MVSYGKLYSIPFRSRRNDNCVIEILQENYTGQCIELKASASGPFSVVIDDDDFLYCPKRLSSATMRFVTSDYLTQLYANNYQQNKVNFYRNGEIAWCGFISPELYTQDYSAAIFELEIECISAISSLENIEYKQAGENRGYVTMWQLLKDIVEASRGDYERVYIPYTYASSRGEYIKVVNVLEKMKINEQNFFDEDDKAMTYLEILEEVCKFLNWTVNDYAGSLYFVDVDHLGVYKSYTRDFSFAGDISANSITVQSVGFAGASHSLDIVPGYNKATVRCSNYGADKTQWEIDTKTLKRLLTQRDIRNENKASSRVYYYTGDSLIKAYLIDSAQQLKLATSNDLTSSRADINSVLGALPAKICNYEYKDNEPSIKEYNYDDIIQVRYAYSEGPVSAKSMVDMVCAMPILTIKKSAILYKNGAFAFSGQAQMALRNDMQAVELYPIEYNFILQPKLRASFRIGTKYYDGGAWQDTPSTFELVFPNDSTSANFDWHEIDNTKQLWQPYEGLKGTMIVLPEEPMLGDLEINIFPHYDYPRQDTLTFSGIRLKGFSLDYADYDADLIDDADSDRIYENTVNEVYVNELDEIEFKITSQNDDGAAYSKAVLNDDYLTNNLYSSIYDELIRPEEQLIRRISAQYQDTKMKLTQVIKNSAALTPLTTLSDKFMQGKSFVIIGGEIDYAMNKFTCKMVSK